MLNISIYNKKSFGFDVYKLSSKIIKKVLSVEKISVDISVSINIVGLRKIRRINLLSRKIDKATDVLSFPNIPFEKKASINEIFKKKKYINSIYDFETNTIFLGDIIICYDKVLSQSKKYNHSIKREYSFLLTHAMLHLIGYDHMTNKDETIMISKQNYILNNLNIIR